ncbi:MAG: cytidine deaminase [Bacteroidota bacterium]
MKTEKISLNYTVYDSTDELPNHLRKLLKEAKLAIGKAYAPYSHFKVGAAVELVNGAIVSGANCENASYPLCICAEPAALAAAASAHPGIAVKTLAITAANAERPVAEPAPPCGACRQMLVEHEDRFGQPIQLVLKAEIGEKVYVFDRVSDLLPLHFSGAML